MAIREATVAPNDPAMIEVLAEASKVSFARGKYAEAETTYRRVLAAASSAYPADSPARSEVMVQTAEIPHFESAMVDGLVVYGKGSRNLIPICEDYSSLLWRTGRKIKASKVQARAKSIRVRKRKQDP